MGDVVVRDTALTLLERLEYVQLVPDPHDYNFLVDPETGKRWRQLTPEMQKIADFVFEGCSYRDACQRAGIRTRSPAAMSSYVSHLLGSNQPFINYLLSLYNEARKAKFVTLESHLQRLEHLSRLAEKSGKISAAVSAEVARGRAGGLYARETADEDKARLDTIKDVEKRIAELVKQAQGIEKGKAERVVAEQEKPVIEGKTS